MSNDPEIAQMRAMATKGYAVQFAYKNFLEITFPKYFDTLPSDLSEGERMRLCMAFWAGAQSGAYILAANTGNHGEPWDMKAMEGLLKELAYEAPVVNLDDRQ